MESIVSIIIPYFEKNDFLSCCLSSIRRQTYKNVETIITSNIKIDFPLSEDVKLVSSNEYNLLNSAFSSSSGDFILFCSPSCFLSPTLLENAMLSIDDYDYAISGIMIKEKNDFKEYKWNRFSYWGKIFSKQGIQMILDAYGGDCTIPEFDISCHSVLTKHAFFNDYIYETIPSVLEKKPIAREELDHVELWLTQLNDLPKDDRIGYINKWISHYKVKQIDSTKIEDGTYNKVNLAAKVFSDDNEIIYYLTVHYLKKWYSLVIERRDIKAFEGIKAFFSHIDVNDRLKIVLSKALSITPNQYDYLLDMNIDDYLFFYDKLP